MSISPMAMLSCDLHYALPGGAVFTGTLQDGFFSGRGMCRWPFGATYSGDWKRGLFHGEGCLTDPVSGTYRGSFRAGRRHGFGRQRYPDGSVYIGDWFEDHPHGRGRLRYVLPGGVVVSYEGGFELGQRCGQGNLFFHATEEEYRGTWSSDRRDGEGKYRDAAGTRYSGHWRAGLLHGWAQRTDSTGKGTFSGIWRDGQRSGAGLARHSHGHSVEGVWVADTLRNVVLAQHPDWGSYSGGVHGTMRGGTGNMAYPSGAAYTGLWRGDVWQAGALTLPTSAQIRGRWCDTMLVASQSSLHLVGRRFTPYGGHSLADFDSERFQRQASPLVKLAADVAPTVPPPPQDDALHFVLQGFETLLLVRFAELQAALWELQRSAFAAGGLTPFAARCGEDGNCSRNWVWPEPPAENVGVEVRTLAQHILAGSADSYLAFVPERDMAIIVTPPESSLAVLPAGTVEVRACGNIDDATRTQLARNAADVPSVTCSLSEVVLAVAAEPPELGSQHVNKCAQPQRSPSLTATHSMSGFSAAPLHLLQVGGNARTSFPLKAATTLRTSAAPQRQPARGFSGFSATGITVSGSSSGLGSLLG